MGKFTFVPVWFIQDMLVFVVAAITVVYIVKNEKRPETYILEFICFVLLNAAVYENFATLMGWYAYGRSSIMVFNVPIAVPVFEYLIVYASLKLLESMDVKTWMKPFIVGFFGMLADFTLDPVALKQVFTTNEMTVGRWTWYPGATDVQIFNEPVYNFTGWILLCGFAAAMLLLGRYWFKKSGYKSSVGYAYPVLTMLGALGLLMSPLSQFLLWLAPFMQKGSIAEVVMICVLSTAAIAMLVFGWKGKMKSSLPWKTNYPLFLILIGFHASNAAFMIIGGYWDIAPLVLSVAAAHTTLIVFIQLRGKKVVKSMLKA